MYCPYSFLGTQLIAYSVNKLRKYDACFDIATAISASDTHAQSIVIRRGAEPRSLKCVYGNEPCQGGG